MLKHFFRNLFYIITVLAAAFGVFALILGLITFVAWGGMWAAVAMFGLMIVGIAFLCARKDYKEEQEEKYKDSYCTIGRAYDNLFDVIRYKRGDYQTELKAFQDAMEHHRETYGKDIHYESYYERFLQLKQFSGLSD